MQHKFLIRTCLILTVFLLSHIGFGQNDAVKLNKTILYKQLEEIPGIDSIIKLPVSNQFLEKYEIYYKQLIDANDSTAGFFNQRIFLSHKDYTKPMVFVTEGYTANYAQYEDYSNELTTIINGNQIVAEHRYFGKSKPDSLDWKYLTVENAAHDHHELISVFKRIYTGKWITTGISKGGQTALIYMSLYPDDVDFSVPYVAPLNFGIEDGRHEPFINKISNKKDRKKVEDFQLLILKRRDSIFPLFEDFCKKNKYTFRLPLQEIYDYCVLEYSFSFWQWGHRILSIPDEDAALDKIFNHFMLVSSPSYFAVEEIEPTKAFFVQAYKQMGYYGYDTKPFKGLLKIKNAENYLQKIFLPEDAKDIEYDKESMLKVQNYLDNNDPKMIFLYGEFDPWSATAVEFGKKENMIKIVKKGGSHATRINNLPEDQKNKVLNTIDNWLKE